MRDLSEGTEYEVVVGGVSVGDCLSDRLRWRQPWSRRSLVGRRLGQQPCCGSSGIGYLVGRAVDGGGGLNLNKVWCTHPFLCIQNKAKMPLILSVSLVDFMHDLFPSEV